MIVPGGWRVRTTPKNFNWQIRGYHERTATDADAPSHALAQGAVDRAISPRRMIMAVPVEIEPASIADATAGMMDQAGPSLQRCRCHDMFSSPSRTGSEDADGLARPTDRPRLWVSIRDAAGKLYDRAGAVQQWAEPRDAALLGAEPIGRALQGGSDARQVDLLPPQRKCCGQTAAAGSCASFR